MLDQNQKKEVEKQEDSFWERRAKIEREEQIAAENKEISSDEKIIEEELRKEIELMQVDDNLKEEAKKKAQKIQFLGEKEKLEHLLQIAMEKGVIFAVKVAKEMKDPYLLDIFHDILAREGYYKDFTK